MALPVWGWQSGAVLWLVHIDSDGREAARSAIPTPDARCALPLRQIVGEALRHGSAAVAIVRRAAGADCHPTPADLAAIEHGRASLQPVGIRLHDYILWYDDRCVSLKRTGRL